MVLLISVYLMSNNIEYKLNAYCINLDREYDKYKDVCDKFGDILNITRVSAIDGKSNNITGKQALLNTNIKLFRQIIQTDDKYAIVIEDDIYKINNFDTYWPVIVDFINNNDDWDFISLDHFLNFEKPLLHVYNENFYKILKSRSMGFMIYNTKFLKKNIEYLSSCDCLDMTMKHNINFIQLIPKTMIVRQIVNKISGTCNNDTKRYEEYYNLSEKYLKDNDPSPR